MKRQPSSPTSPKSRKKSNIDERLTSQIEKDSSAKSGLYAYRIPQITLKNFGYNEENEKNHDPSCEWILIKTGLAGGDLFDRSCRDEVLKFGPELLSDAAKKHPKIAKSFDELISVIESLKIAEDNTSDEKLVANLYMTLFQDQAAVSFEHEFAAAVGLPLSAGWSAEAANIFFAGANSKGQPKASLGPSEWVACPAPVFYVLQGMLRNKHSNIKPIPDIIDYCCFATLLTSQFCHFTDYWAKDPIKNEDVIKKNSQYTNLVTGETRDMFDVEKLGRAPPGDQRQENLTGSFLFLRRQQAILHALRTLLATRFDKSKPHEAAFITNDKQVIRLPDFFCWCVDFTFPTSVRITDDHGVVIRSVATSEIDDGKSAEEILKPIKNTITKFQEKKVHENLNDNVNRVSVDEWNAFSNLAERDLIELNIESDLRNKKSDTAADLLLFPKIRRIDDAVFRCCKYLARLELELDNLKSIGDNAFTNNDHLEYLWLKSDSLESIGDNFFAENKNCTLSMQCDSLKKIGSGAFLGCENVRLSHSSGPFELPFLEEIGDNFLSTAKSIVTNTKTKSLELSFPSIRKIGSGFMSECTEGFSSVTLLRKPSSSKHKDAKDKDLEIGSEMFSQSIISNISLVLDASAIMIEEKGFSGTNSSFQTVEIDADNLSLVGKRFFYGCDIKSFKLTSKKLTDFECFNDFSNDCESIDLSLDELEDNPFKVGNDVHYENIFNNRRGLKTLRLRSKSLKILPSNFLCKCDNLEKALILLPSLTNIGSKNFSRCPKLVSLRVSGKVSQDFAPDNQFNFNDLTQLVDIDSSFCSSLNDDVGLELVIDHCSKLNSIGGYFGSSTAFKSVTFLLGARQKIEKVAKHSFCNKAKKMIVKRGNDSEKEFTTDTDTDACRTALSGE